MLWITEYCKTQIPPSPSGWAEDVSHRVPTEETRVIPRHGEIVKSGYMQSPAGG